MSRSILDSGHLAKVHTTLFSMISIIIFKHHCCSQSDPAGAFGFAQQPITGKNAAHASAG